MDCNESESNRAAAPAEHSTSLPVTPRRHEANEWALVLSAEGFEPVVVRCNEGYRIDVAAEHVGQARNILLAWRREREERAERVALPTPRNATTREIVIAYALALCLLGFHLGLEFSDRHGALVEVGANQARRVLDSEYWRLVTALTLHADLAHVIGNTLFAGFFLAVVTARLGIGLGLLAFVVTGSLGNLANDLYYGWNHHSIGASTGVFGLVGVLTGLAAWRRNQLAGPGRGAWVAFGAGLGLVAMIGSGGPRVDLSAHLFGLVVGAAGGFALAAPLASRPLPGRKGQSLAFAVTAAVVLGAWCRALRDLG